MTSTERITRNRTLTPLWIIALFVSLTEVTLGVAVTQTSGGVQIALTGFVITFPVLIAGGFFTILWHKPFVFYHPSEYGEQVSVRQYVEAMLYRPHNQQFSENGLDAKIQEAIHSTLTSTEIITQLTKRLTNGTNERRQTEVSQVLESAAKTAVERVRKVGFLTLDSRPLLGSSGKVWRLAYEQFYSVSDLLNDIYLSELSDFPPFTYGQTWVLRDADTGRIFRSIGSEWTKAALLVGDRRPLKVVGINPGMSLQITRPE